MRTAMSFRGGDLIARRQRALLAGQTLIIAMIVLGVLLVIGFVFLGVVNRNIQSAGRQQQRTLAGDLAEAGIRYAHSQLLTSELGADWRGQFIKVIASRDPDSDLLGTASVPLPNGPDGLGAYTRVNFENGRALVRVRYGPAKEALFNSDQNKQSSLREPAKAHNYLLIESYGRPGSVNNIGSDPTAASPTRTGNEKKLIAMVSIGIVEHARAIWNKYNVSRPAELGVPSNLGIQYAGVQVSFPIQLGTTAQLFDFTSTGAGAPATVAGQGSFFSNADVKIYGTVETSLAQPMGDQFKVAGSIIGADGAATLQINTSTTNSAGVWQAPLTFSLTNTASVQNGLLASLNSSDDNFDTLLGVLRDGERVTDMEGFPRAVGRTEPPSLLVTDPDTGLYRYVRLTRESGPKTTTGENSGRYGYGRGIYVDNFDDRQAPADETGRTNVGTAQSLVYDWLNPNNGQAGSGWQGPFYIPRGAFLKLVPDGFVITRDSRSTNRTWKDPTGADTGSPSIRCRIGNVPDSLGNPRAYIVNTFTPGIADINAATVDYTKGQPFNGVLYFEGNVRVRGQVATDIQLSVVSNATIYIEGSITKGVIGTDYTNALPAQSDVQPVSPGAITKGVIASRPSTSMIGLFAKDYVALNTTQFFGSSFNQSLEEVRDVPTAVGFNPIRMRTGGGMLGFVTEFLLDPATGTAGNPSSEMPFAMGYQEAAPGGPIAMAANLVLTQTSDDGPAPDAFTALNVNPGLPTPPYLFTESGAGVYNSASTYFTPSSGYITPPYGASTANNIPMYGLGGEPWQRYSKFETMAFPFVDTTWTYAAGVFTTPGTWPHGTYNLNAPDTNDFQFYPGSVGTDGSNDILFARLAIAPHDVRIEAAIYAEEGSFFVIPGPPFNPNPMDTRENYATLGSSDSERQLARLENYGAGPNCPFYNEPLDVHVEIVGAVSENMPPPINQQAEWLKRWGWIPGQIGANDTTGQAHYIPLSHTNNATVTVSTVVPNLSISYDPSLGTARAGTAFDGSILRADTSGRALPPIPRLPVSPTLAYFGEVNP